MKHTHQLIVGTEEQQVTAWQFNETAPIPVWVARKFHRIEQTGWQGIAIGGDIVEAHATDWAVIIEDRVIVLTETEFQFIFKPIPLQHE